MSHFAAKFLTMEIGRESLSVNLGVGTVNVVYKEIPTLALSIITLPMKLPKTLLNLVSFLKQKQTQDKNSNHDLTIPTNFKVTYPKDWHSRQTMPLKDKCDHFNNWASKL